MAKRQLIIVSRPPRHPLEVHADPGRVVLAVGGSATARDLTPHEARILANMLHWAANKAEGD